MSDIERTVAKRLMAETGIRCVLEVPEERPEEFLSVELVGSTGARFTQRRMVAVQSWAKTRQRAAAIAGLVEQAVPALEDEPEVFSPVATSTYRFPDPDSKQERYQTTVELTVCE